MDGGTAVTDIVIGAAIAVHRELGPGLLESTVEACLVYELAERGVAVERQKSLPVNYRGVRIDCGYRIDLLVGNEVVVELKAVEGVGFGEWCTRLVAETSDDTPFSLRVLRVLRGESPTARAGTAFDHRTPAAPPSAAEHRGRPLCGRLLTPGTEPV